MPVDEVVFALLLDANLLELRDVVALGKTCTTAWHPCQSVLATWKEMTCTFRVVLDHMSTVLPRIKRSTGSLWTYDETQQASLYDSAFWGERLCACTPPQLALVYAMLAVHFPCHAQRVENLKSRWSCIADPNTLLPVRLPTTDGAIGAPCGQGLVRISIVRNIVTGKVQDVEVDPWFYVYEHPMTVEALHVKLDVPTLDAILSTIKHAHWPLTKCSWLQACLMKCCS